MSKPTPSFSSFPDLESAPDPSPSRLKDDKKYKSKKLRQPYDSHLQKSVTSVEDVPLKQTTGSGFYVDKKGDPMNITYGRNNSRGIPRYRLLNHGRSILGLPPAFVATSREGSIEIISWRKSHIGITDSKARSLLTAPAHTLRKGKSKELRVESEFIPIHHTRTLHAAAPHFLEPASETDQSSYDSEEDFSQTEDAAIHLTPIQKEIRALEQNLNVNPESPEKWLRLLALTVSAAPEDTRKATSGRAEISVSVLKRGIVACPTHHILRLSYLKAGEEIWDLPRCNDEWEKALKLGHTDIWMEWLEWIIRTTKNELQGILVAASRIAAFIELQNSELAKVRLFWRLAVAIQAAGYQERATAMFQAQCQLTFHCPHRLQDSTFTEKLGLLEDFWDRELPRVGENGYKGWSEVVESTCAMDPPSVIASTSFPVTSSCDDPYSQWCLEEKAAMRESQFPRRSQDGLDSDPFATILFEDIRQLLVPLHSPSASHFLRLAWLCTLGLHLPGLKDVLSDRANTTWDDNWCSTHLIRPAYLNALFPDPEDSSISIDSLAGVIVGREKVYKSIFGPVHAYPYDSFSPLDSFYGSTGIWSRIDIEGLDLNFIRNLFSQLRQGPTDHAWDTLSLAFEAADNVKRATTISKQLLATASDSLAHWGSHAALEQMRGRHAEARRIYHTLLIGSKEFDGKPGVVGLWYRWAEMEWLSGNYNQSIATALKSVGIDGHNGASILKGKQRIDEQIVLSAAGNERYSWTKLRALLELLSSSDPARTMNVFDNQIKVQNMDQDAVERLTMASLLMLYRHLVILKQPLSPRLFRERALLAVKKFPNNSVLSGLFLEAEKGQAVWGRIKDFVRQETDIAKDVYRYAFDVWMTKWDNAKWRYELAHTGDRLRAGRSYRTRGSNILWRLLIEIEIRTGRLQQGKALLYRAIHECPYTKELYMVAFGPLRAVFSSRELSKIGDTMAERGIRLVKSLDETVGNWNSEEEESDARMSEGEEWRAKMPY